jgi:hypothetical protein
MNQEKLRLVGRNLELYFFLLNTSLKTDKKGRNMQEVDHTLHITVYNYSAVVSMFAYACVLRLILLHGP